MSTTVLLPLVDKMHQAFFGHISLFDEASGLGVATSEDGINYPFHCISIADGSRTIVPGTKVSFNVAFRTKRIEAVQITNR